MDNFAKLNALHNDIMARLERMTKGMEESNQQLKDAAISALGNRYFEALSQQEENHHA